MTKYAIVYSSRTGNTKLIADTIRQELPKRNCIYFGEPDDAALEADRIYLCFWTDRGTCNEGTANFIKKLKKHEVILFGTAGFGNSPDYFNKIIHHVRCLFPEKAKFIGSYMCLGKMPMVIRKHYENLKKQSGSNLNIDGILRNFDIAAKHPSKDDLNSLKRWLRQM